jgi:hypothetical protein
MGEAKRRKETLKLINLVRFHVTADASHIRLERIFTDPRWVDDDEYLFIAARNGIGVGFKEFGVDLRGRSAQLAIFSDGNGYFSAVMLDNDRLFGWRANLKKGSVAILNKPEHAEEMKALIAAAGLRKQTRMSFPDPDHDKEYFNTVFRAVIETITGVLPNNEIKPHEAVLALLIFAGELIARAADNVPAEARRIAEEQAAILIDCAEDAARKEVIPSI